MHNIIKSDRIYFTFIRSSIASLSSALADLSSRVFFYSLVLTSLNELSRSNIAVAIGAIIGGIVNCMVNYKFTFHAYGQNISAVVVKFLIVWAGNLVLNMYGTVFLVQTLNHYQIVDILNFSEDAIFTLSTFSVAVLVSVSWNFIMQRYFVFKPNFLDKIL